MNHFIIEPIGYIQTCFPEKFGVPRQPSLVPSAQGVLELIAPFNDPDCVAGLEGVSHVWLTFVFHQHVDKGWKAKVRPPRLGGNEKTGVFATRSSFRPNHLGLSVVTLDSVQIDKQSVRLFFSGVDLLNHTPIIDIKPYVPYVDHVPTAVNGIASTEPTVLPVRFLPQALLFCESYIDQHQFDIRPLITEVLQQDPRPAYHNRNTQTREYGIALRDCNVRWSCLDSDDETIIVVREIVLITGDE